LDRTGQPAFETVAIAGDSPGAVSVRTLNWLATVFPEGLPTPVMTANDFGISLYGLDISTTMQIMHLDAVRAEITEQLAGPGNRLRLWRHPTWAPAPWGDPFELIVPSECRNRDIDIYGLCDFLGVSCPNDLTINARSQATVAYGLAFRAGLTATA
jgi:hypothetical protein